MPPIPPVRSMAGALWRMAPSPGIITHEETADVGSFGSRPLCYQESQGAARLRETSDIDLLVS